jgi:hypothetical protein
MISQDQLNKLRGAKIRVITPAKDAPVTTGTLRVVDHEIPAKGQTLNLEVALPTGKAVTLQLTGTEAKQLIAAPEAQREFRWNGKVRSLRPVAVEDMIPADRAPYLTF